MNCPDNALCPGGEALPSPVKGYWVDYDGKYVKKARSLEVCVKSVLNFLYCTQRTRKPFLSSATLPVGATPSRLFLNATTTKLAGLRAKTR